MTEVAAPPPPVELISKTTTTTVKTLTTEAVEGKEPTTAILEPSTAANGTSSTNGTTSLNGNGEPAAALKQQNGKEGGGETPKEKKKKQQKATAAEQPPKDAKEDPIGWLQQQIPGAVHKVNFHVLDWLQKLNIDEESQRPALPTKKGEGDAVTRSSFLAHLRDGQLLAQTANKYAPGTVATVHSGEAAKEKANQTANIEAFIKFAKENAGLTDEQVFTAADLQEKGKAGYTAVMNTLFHLGLKAQEQFHKAGIDVEKIIEEVERIGPKPNLIQSILNFLKNAGSTVTSKLPKKSSRSSAPPAENGTEVNGTENAASPTTTPTELLNGKKPEKTIDVNGTTSDETVAAITITTVSATTTVTEAPKN